MKIVTTTCISLDVVEVRLIICSMLSMVPELPIATSYGVACTFSITPESANITLIWRRSSSICTLNSSNIIVFPALSWPNYDNKTSLYKHYVDQLLAFQTPTSYSWLYVRNNRYMKGDKEGDKIKSREQFTLRRNKEGKVGPSRPSPYCLSPHMQTQKTQIYRKR